MLNLCQVPKHQTRNDNYIRDYIALKNSGEIEVCEELDLMLQELQDHLDTGDIGFDSRLADGFILWCDKIYKQSKGEWHGKHLKLELWQKAWATAVLSFRTDTGYFYYTESLLLIPRKNGKSELIAALATYLMTGVAGVGIDICCASCDDKTISLLYKTISKALAVLDPKQKMFRKTISELENKKMDCKLFKVSAKSTNVGDGYNIAFCIVDELHMLEDNEMVEELGRAMYAHKNSLTIFITTEGYLEKGALEEVKERCRKKLYKETDIEDRLLAWIYKCDSEQEVFQNEKSWYKANPNLCVSKDLEKLRKSVNHARENRSSRAGVLCKDFSIKQGVKGSSWLPEELIKPVDKSNLHEFRGCFGVVGADLALTIDLCAVQILFFKKDDPSIYVYTHCFIPQGKLDLHDDKEEGADYKQWEQDGYLTIMPGLENDVSEIALWIENINIQYGTRIMWLGYDPNLSKDFTKSLFNLKEKAEIVQQNAKTLTPAIKLAEMMLQHHKVKFDSPVFHWCLKNARIKTFQNTVNSDDVLIIKDKPGQKIDCVVSFIIALEIYRRHKSDIDMYVNYYSQ